jgi:two-component system invasion response regulator UvrY
MIKTMLIDQHQLVRDGIRTMLRQVPDIQVVEEGGIAEDVLDYVRYDDLDLVIMEWNLPGLNGIEVIPKLLRAAEGVQVLVVTGFVNDPFPARLIKAGVAGIVSKMSSEQVFLENVRKLLTTGRCLSDDVAQKLAYKLSSTTDQSPFDELSNRELQVMMMAVEGLRVQDISDKLCLSPKTVSTYRYRMFEKLGVRGEVELTHLAMRYGMLNRETMSDNMVSAH